MKSIKLVMLSMAFLLVYYVEAQHSGGGEANPDLKTNKEALQKFKDLRFGMFIHWGPVSLRGTEIGWSRGKQVPIEEYDNLYKEFNPVLFNAKEWVKSVKDAGMKYIVITTKHHDGFCLWNSKYTDYDIMSTPYKKDVVKELAEECKKQGIVFGTYYSIADWRHPHYATRYGGDKRPIEASDMSIYLQYMKDQLKELIVNYDSEIIWFDGGWEAAYTHEMGMDIYAYIRSLKEGILINDRVDKGHEGLKVKKQRNPEKFAGDYGTPEQRIGEFNINGVWETCMTIADQWAWKPNDKMKSFSQSLHTLLKTVGGGGNLLYNVGPMADGRIEQRQIDHLKQMGDWLKINGEAVYGTNGGPYMPTDNMVCTRKGNKIYLHILKHPGADLSLPFSKKIKIKKAYFLQGKTPVNVRQSKESIRIGLPEALPDEIASVIVLELDSAASDIEVIQRINY